MNLEEFAWALSMLGLLGFQTVSCASDQTAPGAAPGSSGGSGGGGAAPAGGASGCAGGRCRDSGSGRATDTGRPACEGGSGGALDFHSCNCDNTGGWCNSAGGAIGYRGCRDYFESGLKSIPCPAEGGPAKASAFADFCERMAEVPEIFDQPIIFGCVNQLHLGTSVDYRPDGAADAQGFFSWFKFDDSSICDPNLSAALKNCTTKIVPCARPPICVAGGEWGCDDIVAACPSLSMAECRRGFDSRLVAGRERIHACLGADTGNCVEAFYRCAWGL